MTTGRGEISSGLPGHLNEQLAGRVWLCQNRAEWPITILTSASQVITWLDQNPDGVAWEYDVTPKRRAYVHRPEPHLSEFNPNVRAAEPESEKENA